MTHVLEGLFFAILGCSMSLAQYSEQYDKCIDKANTQVAMHACARDEAVRVDNELNNIYQRLLSAAENQSAAVEKIRIAERAWIAYRNAYIDAMYPEKNKLAAYGSKFSMEVDLLRARLTQQ